MALITWNPGTADYNLGTNWTGSSVPGSFDAGVFGASSQTSISLDHTSTIYDVGEWIFKPGAPSYTFTIGASTQGNQLQFVGAGIVDNSSSVNIIVEPNNQINFWNGSSAGGANFNDSGAMIFNDISSAGNATIGIDLLDYAIFLDSSSAGSATIHVVTQGLLEFSGSSTGGNARVTTDGGGDTTFANSSGPAGDNKLTVGSIAGAGTYDLGGDQLTVGSNGLPTEVSGLIDGPGGSLVKVGKGTLELSHANNTYSGGTTLNLGIVDLDAVGAAGTGDVKFAAKSHATLKIENTALSVHIFGNAIDHFGEQDAIDLSGLHFTAGATATYDKTTHHLKIHSGHVTDTLTLISPQGTDFTVATDGHAGTLIFV